MLEVGRDQGACSHIARLREKVQGGDRYLIFHHWRSANVGKEPPPYLVTLSPWITFRHENGQYHNKLLPDAEEACVSYKTLSYGSRKSCISPDTKQHY